MSYFNLSDGTKPVTGGDFNSGNEGFAPIPKGQVVKAAVTSIKWDSFNNDPEFLSLDWVISAPAKYKNRRVFQKLRLNDTDAGKRDKAIRMLSAIYANAGGDLSKFSGKPSEAELVADLSHKFMLLQLDVWEWEGKSGNHVTRVSPMNNHEQSQKVEVIVGENKPVLNYDPAGAAELDSDLPF